MSHIDQGPLSHYNSLVDNNLSGYFTNKRMRRHLLKSGLISRGGHIVSENTYRLNMCRREHKQHVKEMLAQAIVHKTLDLERMRQAEIRKKLEEIAKIELVRRVRMSRQRKRDSDILPYLSPRSESRKRSKSNPSSSGAYKSRSTSAPSKKRTRPISSLSSNYDEDDEDEVEYLDDDGRPIPKEAYGTDRSKGSLDARQLYALDTAALRRYTMEMAKLNQRKFYVSPYLESQVPLPPKSPRSERMPRSARRYRSACDHGKLHSPPRPIPLLNHSSSPSKDQTYLHPPIPPRTVPGPQQTNCVIELMYLGSNLHLAREQFDRRQEILVEQQHCGGNTLVVFKDKLEAGETFSFSSHRHSGYPFALTIYVDGKTDCRVSTCCEYRHQGSKLFGKNGHFKFQKVSDALPCYKCRVENSLKKKHKKTKTPKKKKSDSVDQGSDEVDQGQGKTTPRASLSDNKEEEKKNHLIVPVENEETNGNKYDDDFDSSSRSSSRSSDSRSKSRSGSRTSSGSSRSSSQSEQKEKVITLTKEEPSRLEENKLKNGDSKQNEPKAKSVKDSKSPHKTISKASKTEGWYNSSGSSSSDESDEEKKSKPIQKSSPPPTKPSQIVEVKHEDSDDEKRSTVVEKIRKESTSSSSGSSDSSSSSDDSESERSDAVSSPVAKTSAKGLGENSDMTTNKEKHTPERVIATPTKTAEAAGLKMAQPHSMQTANEVKPAPVTDMSSHARTAPEKKDETWGFDKFPPLTVKPIGEVNQKDDVVPAKDATLGSTSAKDRRNSVSSISSFSSLGSSSSSTSSGSSSSSSSGSSADSKKEGSANGGKKIDDQHNANLSVEETKVEFLIESKDKVISRETQDENVMPEKDLSVDMTLTSVANNEEKPDQQKNRRSSDVSVSSLASSASSTSSSSSSSPSEGSLVLKDEVDAKTTGGEAEDAIIPLLTKVQQNFLETQAEINESLSEPETEEIESKALPEEQEESNIQLVVPPVMAPITMAKPVEEHINTLDKSDSENSSSSDSESDSSSSSGSSLSSGGSHKDSRRGSNASKKSNDENKKQEQTLYPVIMTELAEDKKIEHAHEQKVEHAREKTIEVKEEKEIEQKEEQKTEHGEMKNQSAEKQKKDADDNNGSQVKSNPPEPRNGSILYELEKGNQIVDVKNIKLTQAQIQEVSEFLESKKNMSQLSVVNCDLKDEDIKLLKDAIIASPSKLVVLNLAENQLTAGCMSHLLQLFKNKPSIEAVILSDCNIGNEGVKQLADGLLEEYKNSFQAESKDAQSEEDGNKELRELDLSKCNIGDEGIEALCSLIRSGMSIDTLNLSANKAVTPKGWVAFARSLTKAKVLETLVLDSNHIGNEGLEELARSLYENSSLAALDLNDVGINDKGGKCLIELLKRNTFILEINLNGNGLSDQLVDDINKYISLNKSLNNE